MGTGLKKQGVNGRMVKSSRESLFVNRESWGQEQGQKQIPASGRAFRRGYARDDKAKTVTRDSLIVSREDKNKGKSKGKSRSPPVGGRSA